MSDPKLAEFRDRNIALSRELEELKAKYEGIDPDAVAAMTTKLAQLEATKPTERLAALEAELARERTARIDVQKRADALVIETTISDAFLKSGGVPKARGYIVSQAMPQFTVNATSPRLE